MSPTKKLPTLFISHGGGPWPWMEWGLRSPHEKLAQYLKELPNMIGTPRAILVVSGHWEEPEFTVMTHPQPPMIYDYSGFPENTYRVKYSAPGVPELAKRVRTLLVDKGIALVEDPDRGFDHGVFVPFSVSYPKADVQILQLSMKKGYDPYAHLALGRALSPLRSEGVLIVGSGLSYHNLNFRAPHAAENSKKFDSWLTETVCALDGAQREERFLHWINAPAARMAHPREDHLIPLMVAAGAAEEVRGVKVFSDQFSLFENLPPWEVSGFQFG